MSRGSRAGWTRLLFKPQGKEAQDTMRRSILTTVALVLLTGPSLALEMTTIETHVGFSSSGYWTVASIASDKKAPHLCTLKSTTLALAGSGFDEIKFHFYPAVPANPVIPDGIKARAIVSLWSKRSEEKEQPDTSFEIDADGNRWTFRGRNDAAKRANFSMTIDEANQVLKSISTIGTNRRLEINGVGTSFSPSLFEFDKALVLLKACVEKMR
jgi:hypothetical protein